MEIQNLLFWTSQFLMNPLNWSTRMRQGIYNRASRRVVGDQRFCAVPRSAQLALKFRHARLGTDPFFGILSKLGAGALRRTCLLKAISMRPLELRLRYGLAR